MIGIVEIGENSEEREAGGEERRGKKGKGWSGFQRTSAVETVSSFVSTRFENVVPTRASALRLQR